MDPRHTWTSPPSPSPVPLPRNPDAHTPQSVTLTCALDHSAVAPSTSGSPPAPPPFRRERRILKASQREKSEPRRPEQLRKDPDNATEENTAAEAPGGCREAAPGPAPHSGPRGLASQVGGAVCPRTGLENQRNSDPDSKMAEMAFQALGPDHLATVHPLPPRCSVTLDRPSWASLFSEVMECAGLICQNYRRGRRRGMGALSRSGCQPSLAARWGRHHAPSPGLSRLLPSLS